MRFLPGYIENVGPQVDGIVALDDGSSDGSDAFMESCPQVLQLVRIPRERPAWDEMGNFRSLVAAAMRHSPDWLVSIDADERLERDFRARVERVIRRGRWLRASAFALAIRDIWGSSDRYRVDGIWGNKSRRSLFRADEDHQFDTRRLHAHKVPVQARCLTADLIVYHLRMLDGNDRWERRRRYERLDPEARYQPQYGYAYLTDERGLRLRDVPPRRGYAS
jgi:hypothetical protein